jgi:hypothetical protein
MTFPIIIESTEGRFTATLAGAPDMCVVGATRSEAIGALEAEIKHRIRRGDLLPLEIKAIDVSDLAGKYSGDPTLRDICDDALRQRDAELE